VRSGSLKGRSLRRNCGVSGCSCVQSGTTWTEQAVLPAGGPVAISGSTALVGPTVFVRSGTTWTEQAELIPVGRTFGDSVAISGTSAVEANATWEGVVPISAATFLITSAIARPRSLSAPLVAATFLRPDSLGGAASVVQVGPGVLARQHPAGQR